MGGNGIRIAAAIAVGAAAIASVAAQRPAASRPLALSVTQGGLWEVSGIRGLSAPKRVCVRDTAQLAQFEHLRASCTRVVIRDLPSMTEIHYTCAGSGFGRSQVTVVTPRSLRIETQGISGNAPFNYLLHARRVGAC